MDLQRIEFVDNKKPETENLEPEPQQRNEQKSMARNWNPQTPNTCSNKF